MKALWIVTGKKNVTTSKLSTSKKQHEDYGSLIEPRLKDYSPTLEFYRTIGAYQSKKNAEIAVEKLTEKPELHGEYYESTEIQMKDAAINPWCDACLEKDCLISSEDCSMIRSYLKQNDLENSGQKICTTIRKMRTNNST